VVFQANARYNKVNNDRRSPWLGFCENGGRRMNKIIEFMREHYKGYNGMSKDIGWYMCVPMKVIAEQFGMTVDELGEQTWYWKGDEE